MYYIKDLENNIVLFDENREVLENTLEFTPQYKGYEILETKENEVIVNFKLMTVEEAEQKANQEEAERIAKLHLTKREVFLGLYNAKHVTPDQIKGEITDPSALIEFEYATEYFRGNPLIDMVGGALGITPKQLDRFFDTNDYKELLDENPTDTEPVVPNEETIEENIQ